jgi:hypothetical protein
VYTEGLDCSARLRSMIQPFSESARFEGLEVLTVPLGDLAEAGESAGEGLFAIPGLTPPATV